MKRYGEVLCFTLARAWISKMSFLHTEWLDQDDPNFPFTDEVVGRWDVLNELAEAEEGLTKKQNNASREIHRLRPRRLF